MDSDDSWSTVGRAAVILDNLIADGKAKPMIIVMPAGHTGAFRFGPGGSLEKQMSEFADDFTGSIRPHIEANYRVLPGRENRAIAGLSMGGAQTLNISFDKLADYGYIGVFSSGIFGINGGFGGGAPSTEWEDSHKATLDDPELKKGLKLVWFACGKDDFLVPTNNATIAMLKKHGFDVTSRETDGGHTWQNWRDYLHEFAPLLFQGK
jgi:enterochelin esterase-like enzyme